MSDLISRQAAIDGKICIQRANGVEIYDDYAVPVEYLKQLPPIQPVNCSEFPNNSDTISRQTAIEALKDWYDGMFISSFRGIAKVIDALPPVQPETAKRIVGKSRDGMTLWYQCDMCNEPVDAQDNYCRKCGRRLIDG